MKKVLLVLVAVAVAISFAGLVSAKEKVKGNITTPEGTTSFKVITIDKGKFTTEKGKVVNISNPNMDPSQGIRVEKLKFKQYHDNTIGDADYVTLVNDRGETIRPIAKDAKVNHLRNANDKKITIYSTYNMVDNAWQLQAAEVDELLGQ